jgi:hypothetical protein
MPLFCPFVSVCATIPSRLPIHQDEIMSDIWRLQAQFDNEGLVRALQNAEADIRRRAAVALRTIGAVDAVPALREALQRETDTDTRLALRVALETLSDDPLEEMNTASQTSEIERLIHQLEDENSALAVQAAIRLGEMGDKTAAEPLVVLFTNPKTSGEVKLAIAEALLKLNSAPVEVALLASLRHSHPDVRRKGAAILGHLKAEWAVIPLGESLSDPVQIVRRTARAALKNIGTPEARSILARFSTTQLQKPATKQLSPSSAADAPTLMARPRGLLRRVEAELKAMVKDETKAEVEAKAEGIAVVTAETKAEDIAMVTAELTVEVKDDVMPLHPEPTSILPSMPITRPLLPPSPPAPPAQTDDSSDA